MRIFERLILEENGHRVLEAESADEAFRLATAYDGRIRLLLADIVMPHGSGPELAQRLAPLRPEMGVLYISGLS
jgi:two-component system, cell cycle sensor histidine kinase and response regulator CckA